MSNRPNNRNNTNTNSNKNNNSSVKPNNSTVATEKKPVEQPPAKPEKEAEEKNDEVNSEKLEDEQSSGGESSENEDGMNNIDKDLIPRLYVSDTADETVKEIKNFDFIKRPLIKIQFIKKRRDFSQIYKFNDGDASEKFTEIKQQNDPLFHLKRKVIDIGLQGCNELKISNTQTEWNRKINKVMEAEPDEKPNTLEDDNTELIQFLQNVYPLMEEALQSNETMDIFQNDFELIQYEEESNIEVNEISNQIKEIKTFSDLSCRGKKVTCIQFQPQIAGAKGRIVAESFMENIGFDERIAISGKFYKSFILFWDFEDLHLIEPILILSSPLEILCFEFHPKDPNIVVAGAINGQVLMWDLKGQTTYTSTNKKGPKGKTGEKNIISEMNPILSSALQDPSSAASQSTMEILKKNVNSHKNPVLCLKFFPSTIEFDRKTFQNLILPPAANYNQFDSISEDGQILFWDIRFGDKDPRKNPDAGFLWKAHYGIQLFRPEGGGSLTGSSIAFQKGQKNSVIAGTSDEGELFLVDWTYKPSEENSKADLVVKLWQNERSFRPAVGLDRSPFFDTIIITLHDYHFNIWKTTVDVPIFSSMIVKNAMITCGAFSPHRPGVVIIGKSDGTLDVWDFIDQSHKWSLQYSVVTYPLSCLRFHEFFPQYMAVGDQEGTLHIMELPYTLCKRLNDEEQTMAEFWDREVKRVEYFKTRFEIREEEARKKEENKIKKEQLEQQMRDYQKTDDKKEDEDELMEKEYQELCEQYYKENFEKEDEVNVKKKA